MQFITFLLVMLIATLVLFTITRLAADRLIHQHHAQKVDFFRHYPVQLGDIVFLGDSITDGARWDELFPGLAVKNRGINGDTVEGVLFRLDEILSGKPAAIFLLIGTNDLPWYMYHSDTGILETYDAVLKRIRAGSPQTRIFVQSILPRHRSYTRRIQTLNARLEALAVNHGGSFINLYPHFADPTGQIKRAFSNDLLHLMGTGYARWVEVLKPHIDSLKTG